MSLHSVDRWSRNAPLEADDEGGRQAAAPGRARAERRPWPAQADSGEDRLVHPRIHHDHRHHAEDPADRDRHPGPPVRPARQPPPAFTGKSPRRSRSGRRKYPRLRTAIPARRRTGAAGHPEAATQPGSPPHQGPHRGEINGRAVLPLVSAYLRGERWDSNPRHPGPQQCCRMQGDTLGSYLAGIPGGGVGILAPVDDHYRHCALPHFCPRRVPADSLLLQRIDTSTARSGQTRAPSTWLPSADRTAYLSAGQGGPVGSEELGRARGEMVAERLVCPHCLRGECAFRRC